MPAHSPRNTRFGAAKGCFQCHLKWRCFFWSISRGRCPHLDWRLEMKLISPAKTREAPTSNTFPAGSEEFARGWVVLTPPASRFFQHEAIPRQCTNGYNMVQPSNTKWTLNLHLPNRENALNTEIWSWDRAWFWGCPACQRNPLQTTNNCWGYFLSLRC